MVYYLIKDSKEIYSVLQNGLEDGLSVYSIDSLDKPFEEASKSYVPCVFEIDDSDVKKFTNFALTSNVDYNNITLMDPNEVGIDDAASSIVYKLYKANNKGVKDNINKIASDLRESGNRDLSDYLLLVNKLSFDNDDSLEKFADMNKIKDADLEDALEHASIMFDENFSKDDFDFEFVSDLPIEDLYMFDDIDSWAEWGRGELAEMSDEERKEEVNNFRPAVMEWIQSGSCPPIYIINYDGKTVVGDGRGRVSIAIGMDWDSIPAVFVVEKGKKADSYDRMIKLAGAIDLGNPDMAGKSLADIVLFLMRRIPEGSRAKAISSMIAKVRDINAQEVSGKQMGDYSSMGQSLTFIKNVLAGHKEGYVRRVLDAIVRNLA